jgi:hypothetical protein
MQTSLPARPVNNNCLVMQGSALSQQSNVPIDGLITWSRPDLLRFFCCRPRRYVIGAPHSIQPRDLTLAVGICLCRAHHYPPTPPDAAGRTRGVGAHTDFGALTLLLQDTVGGLEVLHKKTGTWHAVPPIEGAYVCNIGDLMRKCFL